MSHILDAQKSYQQIRSLISWLISRLMTQSWRRVWRIILLQFPRQPALQIKENPSLSPLSLTASFPDYLLPRAANRGREWLAGNVSLPGAIISEPISAPFKITPPNNAWAASLHSFTWLSHLSALGSADSARAMRDAILQWLETPYLRNRVAWTGAITALRFVHFCAAAPHILPLFTPTERQKFMHSLAQQAHFLHKTAHLEPDGMPRLIANCGLAYSAFALSDGISRLHPAMSQLSRELARQVLSDGVHVSRAPDALLRVLPILLAIRDEMRRRELPMPTNFETILTNAIRTLSFFQHGDKRFAVFNGSTETDMAGAITSDYVKNLMAAVKVKRRAQYGFSAASHYYRLNAGKSLLFLDAGSRRFDPRSTLGHAAPLALEFSRGAHRILVNCGPNLVHGADWRQASRMAAAHSMLCLNPKAGAQKTGGGAVLKPLVTAKRLEDKTGQWIEATHNMFKPLTGMSAHRRLYLSATGEDLRVQELLLPETSNITKPVDFALRLHLHPSIRASLAREGKTILLVLPNSEGWRFRADNLADAEPTKLSLEEGIYMGADGVPRNSQQIVVTGTAPPTGITLNWALRLMKKSAS